MAAPHARNKRPSLTSSDPRWTRSRRTTRTRIKRAAMPSTTKCVASTAPPVGPLGSSLVSSSRAMAVSAMGPLFPQVRVLLFARGVPSVFRSKEGQEYVDRQHRDRNPQRLAGRASLLVSSDTPQHGGSCESDSFDTWDDRVHGQTFRRIAAALLPFPITHPSGPFLAHRKKKPKARQVKRLALYGLQCLLFCMGYSSVCRYYQGQDLQEPPFGNDLVSWDSFHDPSLLYCQSAHRRMLLYGVKNIKAKDVCCTSRPTGRSTLCKPSEASP